MSQRTPAEERAYRSGRAAFTRGKDRSENPGHCASSRAAGTYWAWFNGYDDAKAECCNLCDDPSCDGVHPG